MLFDKWVDGSSSLFRWPSDGRNWTARDVPAGRAIFRQGGKPECLFDIISGTLKLSQVSEDGRQIILGFPSSGELVGLTGGKEYRYAAETLTPTRLRLIRWTAFYRQLLQDRAAREKLLGWIDAQEEMTHEHIAMLALQSPLAKLAAFLLRQISRQKRGSGTDHVIIDLPMTQRDIATYLEIAPETCSRAMKKLREERIIAARNRNGNRQLLEILDRKRLNDFANTPSL
jgi:CRP/FNR family transcriptional regulator